MSDKLWHVGIHAAESTQSLPHPLKHGNGSLLTDSPQWGQHCGTCGPFHKRNRVGGGEGGVRLANIKFLITHNLMEKNGSALPEAVDGAGGIPEEEGKSGQVDTCCTWRWTYPNCRLSGKSWALNPHTQGNLCPTSYWPLQAI